MKLSIVIPAYNAEKYIETCLESCVTQDMDATDYQILVVNDGSTDSTENIVLDMGESHPNISIIHQENKGNGAARNTGVEHAIGNYILFLDADDYVAHNTFGTLMQMLEEHDLDLLGFSSKNVTDSSETKSQHSADEVQMDAVVNGIDFIGTYNYKAEVWWYFAKREFYNSSGTFFYDRKFVQDSYLTPTLFSKAKKSSFVNYDIHRYRKSPNSITRNKSVNHLNQHFQDLSFSVKKLFELRKNLIAAGITNMDALGRLHVKQQRYVFIIIVRFIKSNIDADQLRQMLKSFESLEAYPMDKFMSISDYRSPAYQLLTFIFNRSYLLYPAIKLFRIIRR